jgi:H/ACA ribonucleoprotein complex subunit 4
MGPFKEDNTLTKLHDLADAYAFWRDDGTEEHLRKIILPVEEAVRHLPKLVVRDGAVDALCHGASLAAPGVLTVETGISPNDLVAVMTLKGELVSLARATMTSRQIVEADHGIVAKPERVVMSPNTYPRKWK